MCANTLSKRDGGQGGTAVRSISQRLSLGEPRDLTHGAPMSRKAFGEPKRAGMTRQRHPALPKMRMERTMDRFSLEEMREVANAIDFGGADWRAREIADAQSKFGGHVVDFIGHDRPWGSYGRVAVQRFRLEQPCVYFVGGEVGGIKIGTTSAPIERLIMFQLASPISLRIMALTPGGRSVEREYHRRFAEHRLHGEWFSPHPDILSEVSRLQERGA